MKQLMRKYNFKNISDSLGQMKYLPLIFTLAVFLRILIVVLLHSFDIQNDSGIPIKFVGQPAYLDYQIYLPHIHNAWSNIGLPIQFFADCLLSPHDAWEWVKLQSFKPGPLFISILDFSGYENSRYVLSFIYIFVGLFVGLCWAFFLYCRQVGLLGQLLVACYPALIYFSILVSTDLIYAFFVSIFYVLTLCSMYVNLSKRMPFIISSILCLFVSMLIRPNALALIPVVLYVIFEQPNLRTSLKFFMGFILFAMGVYMLIYYLPYFWLHEANSAKTDYWGILPSNYFSGVFSFFPDFLNRILSVIFLGISKILYSVGIRPSYALATNWLVLIRGLPGLILLPGLIYLFWRGERIDKLFVFFFLLPVYIGAAQERYLLAITPLLIIYGFKAYEFLYKNWIKKVKADQ
jgi:hypothetical protein